MSELKHLKFEQADGVARITLNRPKVNMMNIETKSTTCLKAL
jgi:enoyl-CoA hydratase/carnithine racemase